MVLWCKVCNALLGLREPLQDWSTDNTGICQHCLKQHFNEKPVSTDRIFAEKPERKEAVLDRRN
jgi:hypothetical protein